METAITIRDEMTSRLGRPEFVFTLPVASERLSVREIIRARVQQEVEAYNGQQPEHFRGLVQPTGAEQTLNGFRMPKARQIDWQKQYQKALEAFEGNGFIVMINDRQVEDLDTVVEVTPDMGVTFLKLVPLVGG
jgi:hypothetical protein